MSLLYVCHNDMRFWRGKRCKANEVEVIVVVVIIGEKGRELLVQVRQSRLAAAKGYARAPCWRHSQLKNSHWTSLCK